MLLIDVGHDVDDGGEKPAAGYYFFSFVFLFPVRHAIELETMSAPGDAILRVMYIVCIFSSRCSMLGYPTSLYISFSLSVVDAIAYA